MLNVVMLNVVMLNVIMLNVVMLNVIMLSVIMPNVVMLIVVAPLKLGFVLQTTQTILRPVLYNIFCACYVQCSITLSVATTLSRMTFSIKGLRVTLNICHSQHKWHSV